MTPGLKPCRTNINGGDLCPETTYGLRLASPRRHIAVQGTIYIAKPKPNIYGDKHCCDLRDDAFPSGELDYGSTQLIISNPVHALRSECQPKSRFSEGQHIATLAFLPRIAIRIWAHSFEIQTFCLPLNTKF
ncbi:hypothetical protein IW262DRAFT_1302432 [Armillaria fumosa]|nr:hypothetical protein IW262DRAFT_1302432 [Armillaria fumosa]